MKTLGLVLLAGPVGYFVLTAYLLGKVGPVPITLLSSGLTRTAPEIDSIAA